MRKYFFLTTGIIVLLSVAGLQGSRAQVQQQLPNPDDNMKGEDFTRILKDEWSYLKEATDEFLAATAKRSEFETSQEFAKRVAALKAALVNKVNAHIAEKKFDKRVFGVLYKASLKKYDADRQEYLIGSSESVEAPYDIPTLHCLVPSNPYVILADSVNRGFRSSALRVRFPSAYRWKVPRDDARMAKNEESGIYFVVRFILDLRQEDMVREARMRIIPTKISMENIPSKKVYWSENIK